MPSDAYACTVCDFGSFVLGADPALEIMGLGLAVAFRLDATIVRVVLVLALMELLGDRNWWIPRWLDRSLSALNVEPSEVSHQPVITRDGDRPCRRKPTG